MKIGLVFPPPFDLTQPYLSLPMLASFLSRQGHKVVQRDLNLAYYDHVLTRSYLLQVIEMAREVLDGQASAERNSEWRDLLNRAVTVGPVVAELIDSAKAELRDATAFYDPDRYAKNYRILHRGCELLSAAFFPSRITPTTYVRGYETETIAELLAASKPCPRNPFAAVFEELFVPDLVALDLDIVGISVVYSDQIIPTLTLSRLIKAKAPRVPILIGGDVFSHMARLPESNIATLFEFIDGFVLDDGRAPLSALCNGTPLQEIPGIITRGGSKRPAPTPARLENYDTFGAPDFSGLPLQKYFAPPHVLPLLSGKGCEWSKCLFCSESFSKHYAPQSTDVVVGTIERLVDDYGIRCIMFADVDIPPERLAALADKLTERRIEVSWSCYARLTRWMDRALIEKIAQAGCRRLYFGFESASQRVLNLMRKGTQIAKVPEILESCWTAGISPHLFTLVGFPGETLDEAMSTAEFLVDHHHHIGSFNLGAFRLQTFSDAFINAETLGVESTLTPAARADALAHDYRVRGGTDIDDAVLLSAKLTQSAYDRISKVDASFQLHAGSNYVGRKGVPPWNSHSLAYLRNYGSGWNARQERPARVELGEAQLPLSAGYVEVERSTDGHTVIFNPRNGKFLSLEQKMIQLLDYCDGSRSVHQIVNRMAAHGVADSHAIQGLSQALREDLVTLVSSRNDRREFVTESAARASRAIP
ncbi:B12-binding domain-containing radical SAM protein [Rhizobium leguminosarum]